MKMALTYMMIGAGAAMATESIMKHPMKAKRMARRTMRMFKM